MNRREHPPVEVLLALTGEEPAPGESVADAKWMEHLKVCAVCAELFHDLKAWRDAVRLGDSGDAPESWVRRAERRSVPHSFLAPLLGRFRAAVVFDSGMKLAAGTRAEALQGRQWVLAIDRLEIELSIVPADAPESPPLSGQILQVDGAAVHLGGCRVRCVREGNEAEETTSLSTGEFWFAERPMGPFRLQIEGEGWSVQTPILEP